MPFERRDLRLAGLSLIVPQRHADSRGTFTETWTRRAFSEIGIDSDFVQDNESMSVQAGTVRGLHFQKAPFEQAKLLRVLRGRSFHVAVDIRPGSPTFGQWCGIELSDEKPAQLFIARGFAHGVMTLVPGTILAYKVDAPYAPGAESGFAWNDPEIAIDWPAHPDPISLSDKDARLPPFFCVFAREEISPRAKAGSPRHGLSPHGL